MGGGHYHHFPTLYEDEVRMLSYRWRVVGGRGGAGYG